MQILEPYNNHYQVAPLVTRTLIGPKFLVMLIGVLDPHKHTLDGVTLPPIDMSKNISAHMSVCLEMRKKSQILSGKLFQKDLMMKLFKKILAFFIFDSRAGLVRENMTELV